MNNADILGCTACVDLKLDRAKENKMKHELSPHEATNLLAKIKKLASGLRV